MTTTTKTRKVLDGDLAQRRRQVAALEPVAAPAEQAEDELVLFFGQSLDLLCIASLDGYFKRLNPAWTTLLGWSLEQLEARPFLDFVHPDDRESTQAEVARLTAGADTIDFENRYRRADGTYRWLRWNARPMPGRRRIYAVARDVTRQKRLEREVLEMVDRERERLGRELHDGLCQTLAGIAALSATLARRLAQDSGSGAADAATANEITGLVNEAIAEARGLARGLDPVSLQECGLAALLGVFSDNVRHLFRIDCDFHADPELPRPGPEAEAHLFRIAQEAVNNAVSHGRAEHIEIRLDSREDQAHGIPRHGLLSIRDDGSGLPDDAASDLEGIGMHTMAYRSRLIGASLETRRRAGRGTAVICAFPLPDRSERDDVPETS